MSDDRYREAFPDEYSIRHKRDEGEIKRVFHIHEVLEISFIRSGDVTCSVSGETFRVSGQSVLIFNNMDLHSIEVTSGGVYDRYVLYFKPEYIEFLSSGVTNLLECFFFRPFEHPHLLSLSDSEAEALTALLDSAIDKTSRNSSGYGDDLETKFALGGILIFINRLYRARHGILSGSSDSDYGIIYSSIDYINKHLDTAITLDALAKNAFVDKHYLCKLFGKVTGVPPIKYVINCRILKAKGLLLRNCPVEEVCAATGFNNLPHFSRTFKKEVGISPKKYAMKYRGQSLLQKN